MLIIVVLTLSVPSVSLEQIKCRLDRVLLYLQCTYSLYIDTVLCTVLSILDGNSEHVAHVQRK